MLLTLSIPWLLGVTVPILTGSALAQLLGPYTAQGAFNAELFEGYHVFPLTVANQPRPILRNVQTGVDFLAALTDPNNIPQDENADLPRGGPNPAHNNNLAQAVGEIGNIFGDEQDSCPRCVRSLTVAQILASNAPDQAERFIEAMCERFYPGAPAPCGAKYKPIAPVLVQVMSSMNQSTRYGKELFCHEFVQEACPRPQIPPLDISGWFPLDREKNKPHDPPRKTPTGQLLKVLHLSDIHIDPRYGNGAVANCRSKFCCRRNVGNPNGAAMPASRFGSFLCDAPISLVAATLEAARVLAQMNDSSITLFTGDLVAHDPVVQRSKDYVYYSETVVSDLLRRALPGRVYPTLGNHDTHPPNLATHYFLEEDVRHEFDWLYNYVFELWENEGWLPEEDTHDFYGAYVVTPIEGLRIISLNTNLLWDRKNYFNYINVGNRRAYRELKFLLFELLKAEYAGDRVWIIGHLGSGWDGFDAMEDPTSIFYHIVDRFSPHVIANIFWGDTHEDQVSIYYGLRDGAPDLTAPQTVSWTAPSVTPRENLNVGFRVYEVDSGTFEVVNAYTYIADVNTFGGLNATTGPNFALEYNTRDTYGGNILRDDRTPWGPNDPLDATWWHRVTEQMEINPELIKTFHKYQGKSTENSAMWSCHQYPVCRAAKVCYIRSGSAAIARSTCPLGYGSTKFKPPNLGQQLPDRPRDLAEDQPLGDPLPQEVLTTSNPVSGTGDASAPPRRIVPVLSRVFGFLYRVEY